jgi:ABC-2 type transport system ATP-binding protein
MLLDEPTAGLDPVQRGRFRQIRQNLDRACSVVVPTHQIDDLGELFDNVVWLFHGMLSSAGSG